MLNPRSIVMKGRSDYAHEQEALEFIRAALPESDRLLVWELVELVDPSTGRLHEIDALILGPNALYVVEIKGGPGVYTGDTVDWYRQPPGQNARPMTPPYKLTNFKAKVLKGLLSHRMGQRSVPWIQPLVFLSNDQVELKLRNYGDQCVVTQKNFVHAITHHKFPGSDAQRLHHKVNAPQIRELSRALKELGVRESEGGLRVGSWVLGEVLEGGNGYEDRLATHVDNEKSKRRARSYLVPEQTSTERRQQLRRAANRESQLLEDVKGHPNILHFIDYVSDAPLGPTVLFDHFDGVRLDAFIRQESGLSFADRIELIAQVGRALDHCHKKEVQHCGLSPASVLVRRNDKGEVDSRLYNFQLGGGQSASHTVHWSALSEDAWAAYQAPELRENPASDRQAADVFSLGALAYFILTGRAPAENGRDADEKLREQHFFDPLSVDDSLSEPVADCVREATQWNTANRLDDPGFWVEILLERATAPDAPEQEQNPLEAKAGEILAGEYRVEKVLGQGASSRVLQVQKGEGASYALKIALNEHEDERLSEEATVLKSLRHPRLVQLFEELKVGGRNCLLLALAGDRTLQRRLKDDGLISLDYAARYGEDLLAALEELEEFSILHRDIKPANIGVGIFKKKAQHLTLFDFSLGLELNASGAARHGLSQVTIGTAAYRDPYLIDRGAWDYAADRWSAAVTLLEMLTGTRPSWKPEGASPRDPEAKLSLARERFDADVRDQLSAFFDKAFARDISERFSSAEEMRKTWIECFVSQFSRLPVQPTASALVDDVPADSPAPPSVRAASEPPESGGDFTEPSCDLSLVGPDSPLGALPLSSRALNALDRVGVTRAGELASLPDNRLSAVPNVGRRVIRDIMRVTQSWLAAQKPSEVQETPFFAGYGGAAEPLSGEALGDEVVRALEGAGLPTLRTVAEAPKQQVDLLLKRAKGKKTPLIQLLKAAQKEAEDRTQPTSVDGWLRLLLPKQNKRAENLKAVFGLGGKYAGRSDLKIAEVADALGVTRPNLYITIYNSTPQWNETEAFPLLAQTVHELVREAGGALPVERAASLLLERYPATPQLAELVEVESEERRKVVAAAALLRIVGIVEKESESGLRWERLEGGTPWVLESAELLPAVVELGSAADSLAQRETVASSGETVRLLRAAAEGTPFKRLTDERLIELATAASEGAARSSRLEVYPRGLSAKRAVELSNATLVTGLSPEGVQKRVKARYPEAQALPPRPDLDALLEPLGLRWDESTQVFARPEQKSSSLHTQFASSAVTLSTNQRLMSPDAIEASEFEERVRIALERSRFRVLSVRTDSAERAALALSTTFGLELVDLNHEFITGLRQLMLEQEIEEDLIHAIDREGGENWGALTEMMSDVGQAVLERLFAEPKPRLFVNPGLLARYHLDDFLRRLVHSCRDAGAVGTFLLVPAHDGAGPGVPRINGQLVIPEVGAPDSLPVPPKWISSVRKAG